MIINRNISPIKLPSNRKFGYLFSFLFIIVAAIFYTKSFSISIFFISFALFFLIISMFQPNILTPLNKIWMQFGILLGLIIGPIVMGLMFFGMFTPYSLVMSLFGRDELRIKQKKSSSYWRLGGKCIRQTNFKNQY